MVTKLPHAVDECDLGLYRTAEEKRRQQSCVECRFVFEVHIVQVVVATEQVSHTQEASHDDGQRRTAAVSAAGVAAVVMAARAPSPKPNITCVP